MNTNIVITWDLRPTEPILIKHRPQPNQITYIEKKTTCKSEQRFLSYKPKTGRPTLALYM